jgi:hypothetical protein
MAKQQSKNTGKWAEVFACHPNADKIYVAAGVPFLKEKDARNYAATRGEKVEVVSANAKAEAAETTAETTTVTTPEATVGENKEA